MINPLTQRRWSPYLVGAGIGLLSWITFGLMHKALGVSTTFVNVVGLSESLVSPDHVTGNAYLSKYVVDKVPIDWQMMLVVGLFIGAAVAARLGKTHEVERVPEVWRHRFGDSRALRYTAAFVGGVLVLFGARLAGGCTSGHGISGGLQLAVGSWAFFVSFFAAGLAAAFTLYGKAGRRHV